MQSEEAKNHFDTIYTAIVYNIIGVGINVYLVENKTTTTIFIHECATFYNDFFTLYSPTEGESSIWRGKKHTIQLYDKFYCRIKSVTDKIEYMLCKAPSN